MYYALIDSILILEVKSKKSFLFFFLVSLTITNIIIPITRLPTPYIMNTNVEFDNSDSASISPILLVAISLNGIVLTPIYPNILNMPATMKDTP